MQETITKYRCLHCGRDVAKLQGRGLCYSCYPKEVGRKLKAGIEPAYPKLEKGGTVNQAIEVIETTKQAPLEKKDILALTEEELFWATGLYLVEKYTGIPTNTVPIFNGTDMSLADKDPRFRVAGSISLMEAISGVVFGKRHELIDYIQRLVDRELRLAEVHALDVWLDDTTNRYRSSIVVEEENIVETEPT